MEGNLKDRIEVKDKMPPGEFFRISRFKEEVRKTKPHKHEGYYELIFLDRGEGVHWMDTERLKVEPPILFALRPGQLHCWQFTNIPSGYIIMVREPYLGLPENISLKRVFDEVVDHVYIMLKGDGLFKLLENLSQEANKQRSYSMHIIEAYLTIILAKALQDVEFVREREKKKVFQTYTAFSSMLRSKIPGLTKVGQFASLLNMTPQNLNHICRKTTSKPASQLINDEILMEAKRLLIHTDKTIAQISELLNFNDPSHFIKFFKRHTSTTPYKFRDNYFQ